MSPTPTTTLYDHEPSSLVPLLRAHLPHTLVVLSTILANTADAPASVTPDIPRPPALDPVYASFPPLPDGSAITPATLAERGIGNFDWLVAVALPRPSEQVRIHHNLVAASPGYQTTGKPAADAMLQDAIRFMAAKYPAQLVNGNTHDMFEAATRAVVGGGPRTKTYIYAAPEQGWGTTELDAPPQDSWDSELVLDHGQPADAPVIFETNKYRTQEYYALRGAFSTCLRPHSPPDAPAEVWVMTHGDGSLGALWTQPAFRRRGLAKVVLASHLAAEEARGVPRFCYIEEGNDASMRLFASLGWAPLPWCTYWIYETSIADAQEEH